MTCPGCNASIDDAAAECPHCGVIVAKYRPLQRKTTLSKPLPKRSYPVIPILTALSIAGVLAVGGYWYYSAPPDDAGISYESPEESGGTPLRKAARAPGFDVAYELPATPGPVATDGTNLIVGAFRLRPSGDGFLAQQLTEAPANTVALTWNGKEYVGIRGDTFTTHARNTLRLLETRPAPKSLRCLVWDGRSYWAAGTKLLYHLDPDFNVVATSDAPAECRGLTWDGTFLWLADDSIHVIDVSGEKPSVVHSEKTPVVNMNGVVAFKGDIWVTDSDRNLLQRLAPTLRAAWTNSGAATPAVIAPVRADASYNLAALRRQLRSSDFRERVRAKVELQKAGAPIEFDRHENRYVDRARNGAEIIDWSVELRDGAVFGSWKLWFGPDLVKSADPAASYTLTVHFPDGTADLQKQITATAGENIMNDVRLADAAAPGQYRVDLTLLDHSPTTLSVGVSIPPAPPE